MLKWLIGFACVAVLAASGAILFQFYEAHTERRPANEVRANVQIQRNEECEQLKEANKQDSLDYKFCKSWLSTIRKEEEKRRPSRVSNCRKIVAACSGLAY